MPSIESLFPTGTRLVRRLGGRPRRILAGVCAAAAALLALLGAGGRDVRDPMEPVAVASADLTSGAVLSASDVRVAAWPRSSVPSGALRTVEDAAGRRIGAGMGAGEPITEHRLADGGYGGSLRPGSVAVIVAVDAQALLARAGDRVDIYAVDDSSADLASSDTSTGARLVASDAAVLAALPGAGRGEDGQLVLDVGRSSIAAVAAARGLRLTVVVIPP